MLPRPRPRDLGPSGLIRRLLPPPLRKVQDELEARLARIPTTLNEFGVDPFGYEPRFAAQVLLPIALTYRYWLRVETTGIERVPGGRVLLIANHGGNTFAYARCSAGRCRSTLSPRVRAVELYPPTLLFFGR
jgi:hypothetical protein